MDIYSHLPVDRTTVSSVLRGKWDFLFDLESLLTVDRGSLLFLSVGFTVVIAVFLMQLLWRFDLFLSLCMVRIGLGINAKWRYNLRLSLMEVFS